MQKKTGPPSVLVESAEELTKLIEKNDVVVLGLFTKPEVRQPTPFVMMARVILTPADYSAHSPCGKLTGADANLVYLRCPQYKGSTNCPGRGFPQYSLCPYGGIHWISLMKSTRQGNGSSSWTVRGKRGGPEITVKRKKKTKKKK